MNDGCNQLYFKEGKRNKTEINKLKYETVLIR